MRGYTAVSTKNVPQGTKAHATRPIGIRVVIVWRYFVKVQGVTVSRCHDVSVPRCLTRRKEKARVHVFVLLPSLTPKYLGLQSIKCKTILPIIIYMKKLLDSDWLRAVQFKCNTSAKSVTPVQITHRNSRS